MVRAWYLNEATAKEDGRAPNMEDPPRFVSLEDLNRMTAVEYRKFEADAWEKDENYAKLKNDRQYTYEDICDISPTTLPNYDEWLKTFFREHLHADEEIRFIIKGSGYFDVRDHNDKWVRIEAEPGDLLIIPSGVYHRFTLDKTNYVKAHRLFAGEPVWTAYFRPEADTHPARHDYLRRMGRT